MSTSVVVTSNSLKRSPTTIRVDRPSPVLPGDTNLKDTTQIGVSASKADAPKHKSQAENHHGGTSGKFARMRSSTTRSLRCCLDL